MKPKLIETYGGMLTQDELAERSTYIGARIKYSYTEEELSFLMGRPPYYFSDYERMANGSRLTRTDVENLEAIFSGTCLEGVSFEMDEFYAYHEKRIVRVQKEREEDIQIYRIFHPWIQKKNNRKVNEPIVFHELHRRVTDLKDRQIKEGVLHLLGSLVGRSFFNIPKAPYRIYHEVDKQIKIGASLYPKYVKQALYELKHQGVLTMKMENGIALFSSN